MKKDKRKVIVTSNEIGQEALKNLALYLIKWYNEENNGNNVLEDIA